MSCATCGGQCEDNGQCIDCDYEHQYQQEPQYSQEDYRLSCIEDIKEQFRTHVLDVGQVAIELNRCDVDNLEIMEIVNTLQQEQCEKRLV